AQINRTGDELPQGSADDGGAVALHQHHRIAPERARERAALLRFDHEKVGVAKFIILIPERHFFTNRSAEMEDRNDRLAGDAKRHHRRGVMMAYRGDIAARLVDLAMNNA